ncbi:MAG: glycosyltransferase family 4 protein [Cyanobacteria bacterium P01_F01_bin.150]
MAVNSDMRILHVLNHIRQTGNGIVNATIDLACTQAKLGYQVAIASEGGTYEHLLKQSGVQHFQLSQQQTVRNVLPMGQRYGKIIQTFKPDIVHAHMMTAVLLAWGYQQIDRLWGRSPYRFITTVHNEFQRNATLMGLADRVICISQAVADAMERRGVPKSKLRVVLNGPLNSPRQVFAAQQNKSVEDLDSGLKRHVSIPPSSIVTVAGMYQRKGISELIKAFDQIAPRFPATHLYVVGDGPDRPQFEQEASVTSVGDRIHFEGFQPKPLQYMQQADIFVLASHREPFGLVLSEARSAGCAIVASDVDGIPEALDHGQAGILCPPKDSQALARELAQLLNNPDKILEYQQRSQLNLDRFKVERVAEETTAIYGEIRPTYPAQKVSVKPAIPH